MRFLFAINQKKTTLVVLSLNLPQLGIANLRVLIRLLEIGSQQLAFTDQEAKQFFHCRLSSPIEAAESSRICHDVSGWATALQLIALSARQRPTQPISRHAAWLESMPAIFRIIWSMRVCITSISHAPFSVEKRHLCSMNDALITRVTGEETGKRASKRLSVRLFLQRMDDTGEWFWYHPLFGNFPRQRCQWELAAELPEIHRAAAESLMAEGFPSEAIHHALAAGDALMLRDIPLITPGVCSTIANCRCWRVA